MIYSALCLCEAAIFVALVSLYRAATRQDFWSFISSNPGRLFVFSFIIIVFSLGWATHMLRASTTNRKTSQLWIAMNIVTLVLMVAGVEALTSYLSREIEMGQAHHADEKLLGRILYPQYWSQFAAHKMKTIERMTNEGSYLIYDSILGWTIAASRQDKGRRFFSSAEGLRSPRAGMSFADSRTRLSGIISEEAASVRIALIGDSITFGDEVRCEETWGHRVEVLLQPHAQVLNFGVNAYGLNQAFLRYTKDARAWKPQIVVIGIYSDMIKRVNNIYPFLRNPEWNLPFARPRLRMENGIPLTINSPIPTANQIFASRALSELPFLDHDDYYRPYQWDRGGIWYVLENSYVFRLAYSYRPPSDDREQERTQRALQMSQSVIQTLVREVAKDGAVPLVVYHPSRDELLNLTSPLANRMLDNAGIEYVDLTECLVGLKQEAYLEGGHYTPPANAEVARCLKPVLRRMIGKLERHATPISPASFQDSLADRPYEDNWSDPYLIKIKNPA